MFLGIFFCLRSAVGFDFEQERYKLVFCRSLLQVLLPDNIRRFYEYLHWNIFLLYSPLLYYGVLKHRNFAVIY